MKKFNIVLLTTLLLTTSAAFAQQADDGLDDFNIPGVEKSLDQLVEPEPVESDLPSVNEPVAQDTTAKPGKPQTKATPKLTSKKVATPEKPVEVPGVEWVRVTLEDDELKGITFEIPKNWQRNKKKNDWQVKSGSDFDVRFKVGKERFSDEMLKKAPPAMKKLSIKKQTINGIEVAVLSGEMNFKKAVIQIRAAFFTKPRLERNKKFSLMLNSRNIERDGPVFEHILQSVKLGDELLVDWMEGAQKLEFVKMNPGDAGGAIKVTDGYNKAMIPGYKGKSFFAAGIDLNNDGMKEWFVYAKEMPICYGNPLKCTAYIFGHMPDGQLADLGYKRFTNMSVLQSSTNGYRDLAFDGTFYSFDGRKYRSGKSKTAKVISLAKAGPAVDSVVEKPTAETSGPAKFEDYEWVRVGFKDKKLKGITVEVPKHWKSVNDTWGINYGSASGHEFIQIYWADFPKGEPEGRKPPFEKQVINGRTVYLNNIAETYDGTTSYSLNAFFQINTKPKNEPLSIAMTTVNRKRGKPIFDRILQSLRIEGTTKAAEVLKPAATTKTPNVEWVRVTSPKKELNGMSFDVPKNWARSGKRDNWVLKAGSKIEVFLQVSLIRLKGRELAATKAHFKKFTSSKSVINGIPMEILTAENKHDSILYNENFIIFGEPAPFSQGKIIMMFNTSNIERDGPIFQKILQSVRFNKKPVSAKKPPQSAAESDGPVSLAGYREHQIGALSFALPSEWKKDSNLSNSISTIFSAGAFTLQIFHSTGFHPLRNMVDELVPISLAGRKAKRYEYKWESSKDVVLELDSVDSQGERLSFTFTTTQKNWPAFQPMFDRIVSSIRFGDVSGKKTEEAIDGIAGNVIALRPDRAYFMKGDQFIQFNPAANKSDPGYPKLIDAMTWPGVWEDGIDAAVNWGNGKVYFFKGNQYIRFDVAANRSDPGYPRAINGSNWPGLWSGGIDAAINWGNGKAIFFRDNQYIQYDIAADRSDPGYPKYIDNTDWPGLWQSGVDAALNFGNGKAYFFKQDQYLRFDIAANRRDSGYPRAINSKMWPGLWNSDINAATNWGAVGGSKVLMKSKERLATSANTVDDLSGVEFNTDRGGSDYRNFTLKQPDYRICQQACSNEQQCKAWTYVKPGIQGSNARCWLKSSAPDKTANDCCTSGLKNPPATAKAVAPVSPATAENWQFYNNPRFGTSIEYPVSIFVALPPPENGDGRKFESRDGRSSFMIFGSHNALDQSLKELYGEQLVSDQYQAILGKNLQEDSFSFRARSKDSFIAQKVILDNDGVIHTFQMRYKEADEDALEPVMLRMIKSFSATAKPVATQRNKQSKNTGAAQDQAVELAFWQSISQSTDPADFEAYLARWPNGSFAALANNRLRRLKQAAAPKATRQTAPVTKNLPVSGRIYHSPARGTSERKAIMNAARIPISGDIGQQVIFVVSVVRSDGRWAFLQATPRRPNGRKLDWNKTNFAREWQNDAMSDVIMVLLRKDNGRWETIDYVIGPTDVHWVGWVDQYGLNRALFSP